MILLLLGRINLKARLAASSGGFRERLWATIVWKFLVPSCASGVEERI